MRIMTARATKSPLNVTFSNASSWNARDLTHTQDEFDLLAASKFGCGQIYFVIQSESMKMIQRPLAALELLLVFPSVLFMAALFVRSIQPIRFEPARTAQRIVDWYASSVHVGLWLLLIGMPLSVLIIGSATLMRGWHREPDLRDATLKFLGLIRAHASTLLIAGTTVTASGILAIVALHLMTN
jgi:hypothetical protein